MSIGKMKNKAKWVETKNQKIKTKQNKMKNKSGGPFFQLKERTKNTNKLH